MSALRKNIVWLFVLQGANYILPLVTIPYLVRVLGPGNLGRIAFAVNGVDESDDAGHAQSGEYRTRRMLQCF